MVSNGERVKTLIGQSNSVKRVVFSPNGGYLVSGSWNCIIDVWRVSSGEHIKRLTVDFDPIKSLVFRRTESIWHVHIFRILSGGYRVEKVFIFS